RDLSLASSKSLHKEKRMTIFGTAFFHSSFVNRQSSQRGQVSPVILEVFPFRSFKDLGHLCKPAVVDQAAKSFEADESLSDVGVPVDAAADVFLAVVYVKRADPLDADQPVEPSHRLPVTRFVADIVACGEQMACVQAESEPVPGADPVQNCSQMFEPVTQTAPLTRRVLQQDTGQAFHPAQSAVERCSHPRDSRFLSGAHVGAGVEYHVGHSQE